MTDETKVETFPPLEQKCSACGGTGAIDGFGCDNCFWSGEVPSPFGEEVLDFVGKHLTKLLKRWT